MRALNADAFTTDIKATADQEFIVFIAGVKRASITLREFLACDTSDSFRVLWVQKAKEARLDAFQIGDLMEHVEELIALSDEFSDFPPSLGDAVA